MSLATTLAGVELVNPLMNAGGTCKYLEDVKKLARSTVSAVMVNLHQEERPGNSGDTFYSDVVCSVNSLGLPSPGEQYYREHLPEMVQIVHKAGKKIIVNISGNSAWQYARMSKIADDSGVDLIELNPGCPNIWEGVVQKPIITFDPVERRNMLLHVADEGVQAPVGVKFNPASNPADLEGFCGLVTESWEDPRLAKVQFMTFSNTFPNVLVRHPISGKPVISVNVGLAGMGGPAMKPISLGQILQCMQKQAEGRLPQQVEFVGAGGIEEGADVQDYMSLKLERANRVKAVQAATIYFDYQEDPSVFGEILAGYAELLDTQAED